MFFTAALYLSLLIALGGVIFRILQWFKIEIGPEAQALSPLKRIAAASKAVLTILFSRRFPLLLKALILDIFLQIKVLREDPMRGIMHLCIFVGFVYLLLMHALDETVTLALFPNYVSTLNPYFFLRNLFGALVLAGIAIAVYRRLTIKGLRRTTNRTDWAAITLLAIIFFSGFLLDSVQIISPSLFNGMVEDYLGSDDPEEIEPLKAYWAQNYGVAFSEFSGHQDSDLIEQGRELHEESCLECHSTPLSAFISYPLSKPLKPAVDFLERFGAPVWLWYIHFMACFIGLAYLPFSRFFHIISSSVSLLVSRAATDPISNPANLATRRALALDACTHCGTCSLYCSVSPILELIPNPDILPSEKLLSITRLTKGKKLEPQKLQLLSAGSFICTGCHRCTDLCPAGIDLQDLWEASKADLVAKGYPGPQLGARQQAAEKSTQKSPDQILTLTPDNFTLRNQLRLSDQAHTFSGCFGCQTCTNVCPVVAVFENPAAELDLSPHQIMHALGLGLKDMVLDSRMIWDCTTCYMCQESCPQGVQITDILYEMKNMAVERFENMDSTITKPGSAGPIDIAEDHVK